MEKLRTFSRKSRILLSYVVAFTILSSGILLCLECWESSFLIQLMVEKGGSPALFSRSLFLFGMGIGLIFLAIVYAMDKIYVRRYFFWLSPLLIWHGFRWFWPGVKHIFSIWGVFHGELFATSVATGFAFMAAGILSLLARSMDALKNRHASIFD